MREAGRINAEALAAAIDLVKPGVTTGELNEAFEAVQKKYGVISPFKNYPGPYPYPTSICTSVNDELVHGIPGKRVLNEGDIVSIDCGTIYEGFVGDMARTIAVGQVSKSTKHLMEVTNKALEIAISNMSPATQLVTLAMRCRPMLKNKGSSSPRLTPVMVWAARCTKVPRCRIMVDLAAG